MYHIDIIKHAMAAIKVLKISPILQKIYMVDEKLPLLVTFVNELNIAWDKNQ